MAELKKQKDDNAIEDFSLDSPESVANRFCPVRFHPRSA
jgi:hypothetical protein